MRGGVPDAGRSLVQGEAPGAGGSSTRCETWEDDRQRHRMKFQLP